MCHVERGEFAKLLLGRSGINYNLYHESNTQAVVHGMTPKEKFTSKRPDVSHLRVFGCIAYVHVPDEKRSKLIQKLRSVSSLDII